MKRMKMRLRGGRRLRRFASGMYTRYKKMPRRRRRAAKAMSMPMILALLVGAWYFLLGGNKKY